MEVVMEAFIAMLIGIASACLLTYALFIKPVEEDGEGEK